MKTFKAIFFVFALAISGAVFARASVPIINLLDQPAVAMNGQAFSAEQIQRTIRVAAAGKKWNVIPQADGTMIASLSWKNRHTIEVNIVCKEGSYSITYHDSINMGYDVVDNQAIIHPFYNRHVDALRTAILSELARL